MGGRGGYGKPARDSTAVALLGASLESGDSTLILNKTSAAVAKSRNLFQKPRGSKYNLMFYAQSTSAVIPGRYTFCHHKLYYFLKVYTS